MTRKEKETLYQALYDHVESRLEREGLAGEPAVEAVVRELHKEAEHGLPTSWWCGVYLVRPDEGGGRQLELLKGSSPACSPLPVKVRTGGVCADCVLLEKPIVVPDVSVYPGHVYCDARARSEVVVPVFDKSDRLAAVLDVDDENSGSFGQTDVKWLTRFAVLLSDHVAAKEGG